MRCVFRCRQTRAWRGHAARAGLVRRPEINAAAARSLEIAGERVGELGAASGTCASAALTSAVVSFAIASSTAAARAQVRPRYAWLDEVAGDARVLRRDAALRSSSKPVLAWATSASVKPSFSAAANSSAKPARTLARFCGAKIAYAVSELFGSNELARNDAARAVRQAVLLPQPFPQPRRRRVAEQVVGHQQRRDSRGSCRSTAVPRGPPGTNSPCRRRRA